MSMIFFNNYYFLFNDEILMISKTIEILIEKQDELKKYQSVLNEFRLNLNEVCIFRFKFNKFKVLFGFLAAVYIK